MVGRPVQFQHTSVAALAPCSQRPSGSVYCWPLICSQHRGNPAFPSSFLTSLSPCPACSLGALNVLKLWCEPDSLPWMWIQNQTLPLLLQMIPITQKYCTVMQKSCKERIKIQWCLNCSLHAYLGILYSREKL